VTTGKSFGAAVTVAADYSPNRKDSEASGYSYGGGANDWSGGLPAEVTWEADYEAILDAIHAKWPTVRVYIMRPWDRGHDADAAIVSGWITTIQTARSSFVTVGPDEAVWLKGADNGATMTTDGVHYSAAGNAEAAIQWQAVLGY